MGKALLIDLDFSIQNLGQVTPVIKETPVFLDWLKSDGLAYIDTGHKLITIYDKVLIEGGAAEVNDNIVIGGVRWSGNSGGQAQIYFNQYEKNIIPVALTDASQSSRFNYKANSVYIADFYNKIYTLDGVTYAHGTSLSTGSEIGYSLYLFALNNVGQIAVRHNSIKIRRCEIYRNDVMIHNYLPCYYLGEYGMWDNVENRFVGNSSNQGAFIGGKD